jgi:hypothetical protein
MHCPLLQRLPKYRRIHTSIPLKLSHPPQHRDVYVAIQNPNSFSLWTCPKPHRYGRRHATNTKASSPNSRPAKLGASLGWLLQLDGDAMRNAFLNAPWVKAVIPIRPGMELQALNWLKSAAVEGVNGLSALYLEETPGEKDIMATVLKAYPWTEPADIARYGASFSGADVTIEDALRYLAIKIEEKHAISNELQTEEIGSEMKHFMPTDKVFDYGFDPLAGGFQATPSEPFRVFDQWVEVLPTDQLVAVQVQYDPSTGFQVPVVVVPSGP